MGAQNVEYQGLIKSRDPEGFPDDVPFKFKLILGRDTGYTKASVYRTFLDRNMISFRMLYFTIHSWGGCSMCSRTGHHLTILLL